MKSCISILCWLVASLFAGCAGENVDKPDSGFEEDGNLLPPDFWDPGDKPAGNCSYGYGESCPQPEVDCEQDPCFHGACIDGENEAEVEVMHIFDRITRVECKRSSRNDLTFFIEVAKFSYGDWVPSGLNKTQATEWALFGPTLAWEVFVKTDLLRQAVRRAYATGKRPITTKSATQDTRGYLLSLDEIITAEEGKHMEVNAA